MKTLTNALTLFIANSISALEYYAVIIMIARRLGVSEFGDYIFAVTFAGLFVTLPNFGLDRIFIREVSRNQERLGGYLVAVGVARLGLALLAVGLAIAAAGALGYSPRLDSLILILGFSLVANLFSELFRSTFYAFERMPIETLLRLLGTLITVGSAAAIIFSGHGLLAACWVLAAASLAEASIYGLAVYRLFKPKQLQLDWQLSAQMAKACIPLAVNTVFVVLYFKIGLLILSTFKGSQAAGWFGAAFTFVQLLQLITGAVSGVALPRMSRESLNSLAQLTYSVTKVTRYLLLLVFPLCLAISVSAGHLIDLVYGKQFGPAVGALQILAWASVFMFLGSIWSTALISLNKQYWLLWTAVGAAVVSIGFNLALVPSLSYVGSSIATLITEAFVACLCYVAMRRTFTTISIQRSVIRPLVALLAMGGAFYLLQDLQWMLQTLLAAAVYFGVAVVIRAIPTEDLRLFLGSLRLGRPVKDAL